MENYYNLEIKKLKKKYKIPNWYLGEKLGVDEMTILRWLRKELSEEKKKMILDIINDYVSNGGH